MNKFIVTLLLNMFLCPLFISAQTGDNSKLQTSAESALNSGDIASARSLYVKAYKDYAQKGQIKQAVECGVSATSLFYKDGNYQYAFEFLRDIEHTVLSSRLGSDKTQSLLYLTSKERMQMYLRMKRSANAFEQLNIMENRARSANDESVNNDLLYSKVLCYYTFGPIEKGNAVFAEMTSKLTAQKEYDKVDEVYKMLIANGQRSNNARIVAQSYSKYMVWKDSVNALKFADEISVLKQQIADHEATIAEKDGSLSTRKAVIVGLGILAAALAAALVLGALVLMRFIILSRKQKKLIKIANENNALKAKFIGNIASQLNPTLQKLDKRQPEVKAMIDFTSHVQTLSQLEESTAESIEKEETAIHDFCENIASQIRNKVKSGVELTVNAPKMSASINREYVSHILVHLLENATDFVDDGGHIRLEFKKRGAHSYQFIVSNTGNVIPEEKRDDVFKPFTEVKDLTKGDGLGLPICKQMAIRMNGDLDIDPEFTKGTRFLLNLHD